MQQEKKGWLPNETKGILKKCGVFVRPSEPNYIVVISKHVIFFPQFMEDRAKSENDVLKSSKLLIKVTSKLHGSTNSPMQLLKRIGF